MKKWTFALMTMGMLAGAVLLANKASAALQTYPGANCVSTSGSATTFSAGDVGNTTASSMTFVCPITRDMSSFSSGDANGNIWVLDQHFTANICCSSQVLDPIGSLHASASQCTTGSGNVTGLTFSGPLWTGTFGARSFLCTLPANVQGVSTIRAYRSGEL